MPLEDISRRIVEFRQEKKITQSEFARLCGLSAGTIGKIELGIVKPDTDTLIKLSQGLQTTPTQLFGLYHGMPVDPSDHPFLDELVRLGRDNGLDWRLVSPEGAECLALLLRMVLRNERLQSRGAVGNSHRR